MQSRMIFKITLVVAILFKLSLSLAENKNSEIALKQHVATIKEEMLLLGRDMKMLEDILLYPEKTRVSVYLTMDVGRFFSLDKAKILINGEVVSEQAYSNREEDGFKKGAAQRIFVGNYDDGKYDLVAIFSGKGPRGRAFKRGVEYKFDKRGEAATIKINILDDLRKQQPIFKISQVK